MKRKLTAAEYAALTPEMKAIYVADGDGYKLPLVDDEDTGALKRALDREKADAAKAKADLLAANTELGTLKDGSARKTGDIATLEASWQKKMDDKAAADAAIIASQKATIEGSLLKAAASEIAGAITGTPGNASLMLPHINGRLEVVYDGDVATVKVKDKTGRVSAMNFDELQKELVANADYAAVVVASKASGAGGSGGKGIPVGGGAGTGKKSFGEMTGPEKAELFKTDPMHFDQLAKDHKATVTKQKFVR